MLGKKTALEKRIEDLEDKGKSLEDKTKQALELLDTLDAEFEDLQNMMMLTRQPAQSQPLTNQSPQPPVFHQTEPATKPIDTTIQFQPIRLDMTGSKLEDQALKGGWWQSEGDFRWAGKDNQDPAIHLNVLQGRDYELTAKIFIPSALAQKPIRIIANDKQIAEFTVDKEMQIEKKIKIPKDAVTEDTLKIIFKTDFWNPKLLDPTIDDSRTLSLAFDYIRLD